MIHLRGITWDHPRGVAPLVATAEAFARHRPEVRITWEKRSLHAFGDAPVEDLARQYDLIVIDHPHVGTAARENCLVPLDHAGRDEALAALARQSVGPAYDSYEWEGRQWALPIDAAAHVAAWRPDLIDVPPATWEQVQEIAQAGRVLWPLKAVDALMGFYSLAANLGTPCGEAPDRFIESEAGLRVLEIMRRLVEWLPPACLQMNPIQALETLSHDDRHAYGPMLFGYVNYARAGFRRHLIRFSTLPAVGDHGSAGAVLGGTGLAVSRRCRCLDAALDYAFWIAGAECQRGLYFVSGGQPANAAAWDDDDVHRESHGFFRDTCESLESAYLRPRHAGYPAFQTEAGGIVHHVLTRSLRAEAALNKLEEAWELACACAASA